MQKYPRTTRQIYIIPVKSQTFSFFKNYLTRINFGKSYKKTFQMLRKKSKLCFFAAYNIRNI